MERQLAALPLSKKQFRSRVEINSERLPIIPRKDRSQTILLIQSPSNQKPYDEIMNISRVAVFSENLIDIQASEIESGLNWILFNLNDNYSFVEGLHECSRIDLVYPSSEEIIQKKYKRLILNTSKKLIIYKQALDITSSIKEILFDYYLSNTTKINCK